MKRYELVIQEKRFLTIDELGSMTGLQPDMVYRYIGFGLIDPDVEKPQPLFDVSIVARIRKIERLRSDLGINLAGCGLVLDLLERIDELEREIYFLRELL